MQFQARSLCEAETIESPDGVTLSLQLAGLGSRAGAFAIDACLQLPPLLLAIVVAVASTSRRPSIDSLVSVTDGEVQVNLIAQALATLTLFFINFFYFALFETLWSGQTPGKRALGLRVVRTDGFAMDGRAALIRNLVRAIDVLPAFYAVGVVFFFAGRGGRRIGDLAAGTMVVTEAVGVSTAGRRAGGPCIPGLTPPQTRLLGDFLARRALLPTAVRGRVAAGLAEQLARQLSREVPDDAEAFLHELSAHGRR